MLVKQMRTDGETVLVDEGLVGGKLFVVLTLGRSQL